MKKHHDTRSREEILGQAHFALYLATPRLEEIGLRELRTLDAFFVWAERTEVQVPSVADLLEFCAADKSCRRLENIRTGFDRLLPPGTAVQQTVRDAIRAKKPRSRTCDRRSRDELLTQQHFASYRDLPDMERVTLEDLRVLDSFLVFADERRVEIPTVQDFLTFAEDRQSSRRLRSLKYALETLLPGNPGVVLTLQEAIRAKEPARPAPRPRAPRTAACSVPANALPGHWQDALAAMRRGEDTNGLPPPAESRIKNMEEVLRHYAWIMIDDGLPVEITVPGVRLMEQRRTARAKEKSKKKKATYADQGDRPATRWSAVMRLRAFAQHLGLDLVLVAALRAHENALRRKLGGVVPLKFGNLARLPDLTATWRLALRLLDDSHSAPTQATRLRLLNEAAILALWTLLPLRLADGRLRWREDVTWDGSRYRIDVDTQKADVALHGRLHSRLTPFLDALVLGAIDPAYLDIMRERARAGSLPLFRETTGRMLGIRYPSTVWRAHMGTGAHITRTRVHTELGCLGPEGVEAALALCAQRDPRTAVAYQEKAVARAMMKRGQDMIEELFEELEPPAVPPQRRDSRSRCRTWVNANSHFSLRRFRVHSFEPTFFPTDREGEGNVV